MSGAYFPNNRPHDVLSLRERPIDFHLGIVYYTLSGTKYTVCIIVSKRLTE